MHTQRSSFGRPLAAAAAALLCVAVVGCGKNPSSVSGAITLDGQPVQARDGVTGTIMFQPVSGGPPAVGRLDAEGRYTISTGSQAGLTPGEYIATCAINKLSPSPDGISASAKAMSDPKFSNSKTSGFAFTVKPGDNQFDLALQSAPKGRKPGAR